MIFRKQKIEDKETIARLSRRLTQSNLLEDILAIRRSDTYTPNYKVASGVVTSQKRPNCCPNNVGDWLMAIRSSFKDEEKIKHEKKYKEEHRQNVIRGEYADYIMNKMLVIN